MLRIPVMLSAMLVSSHAMELKEADGRVEVFENDRLLTAYQPARTPYLFPLPSPSGSNLARHWPIEKGIAGEEHDHPHHTSLWFSHGAVNGYDFWAWAGDGHPEIRHLKARDFETSENEAAFTVDLAWQAGGRIHLTEARRYHIARTDSLSLEIELVSVLTAGDGGVIFGDTKEGTIGARVDRTLRLKGPDARGHIVDSEGRTDDACWGKRSKWVAFHGPDERGEPAVLAMFDHPSNLRFPTWWHARDYGLMAANPFGIHDFDPARPSGAGDLRLAQGESLTLRYRVLIHHGTPATAQLAGRWKRFAGK